MARTEDDLRAAFALAALDAPSTQDVLARLDAAELSAQPAAKPYRPSRARRWLPAIAVAAAVIAIAVPVGFAISNGGGNQVSSSSASIGGPEKAAGAASSAASGNFVAGSTPGPANSAQVALPSAPTSAGAPAPSGPVCSPDDLALSLAWTTSASGLRGTLTARNIGGFACDLAVKPAVYPLDAHRVRLDVQNVTTAEGYAGPSSLLTGASATSTISWNSWCGAKADQGAQVDWGVGPATVSVSGPTTPSCVNGKSGAISSTWFSPLS